MKENKGPGNRQGKQGKSQAKPFTLRGKVFFAVVFCAYIVCFLLAPEQAILALAKGGNILKKVLPIFALVICFTALLTFLLQPKKLARHLGEESGIRGWLWALAAGIISHGPMYGWYPLLDDLRQHGLRDSLIAVFFAARTIKIPLLPFMVDYFGLTFTIVLSCYILVGAILQGIIIEILNRNKIAKI